MRNTKKEVAQFVNQNCMRASCLICKTGDLYDNYMQCPYFELKQLSRDRKITAEDVPDNLAVQGTE